MSTELIQAEETILAGFQSKDSFELLQRMAKMLAASDLVPAQFKGNIANCVIGLEMAQRINASPLAVMQNLYIVHGKPSWSAQFVTAAINSTGKFSPLRFQAMGDGEAKTCLAWAVEKATGERLEGPPVSIAMAKAEGWYDKNGSKWKTMPDLMLRYRSATFFGRLYAPEVLMGIKTMEEIEDTEIVPVFANQGPVIDIQEPKPTNGEAQTKPEVVCEQTSPSGPEF